MKTKKFIAHSLNYIIRNGWKLVFIELIVPTLTANIDINEPMNHYSLLSVQSYL